MNIHVAINLGTAAKGARCKSYHDGSSDRDTNEKEKKKNEKEKAKKKKQKKQKR